MTSDLTDSLWTGNICSFPSLTNHAQGDLVVEYACISDASPISTGFLKEREDIVAQLQASPSSAVNQAGIRILCAVIKDQNNGAYFLTLTAIRARNSRLASSFRSMLQHLIAWELPIVTKPESSSDTASYSLNAGAGLLHITAFGYLTTYDFSGAFPRISGQLMEANSSILAHLILQGSAILTVSGSAYTIYDVKYNSIQDKTPVGAANSPHNKKRKRNDDTRAFSNIEFIQYFSKLGIAVALQDNSLVAVQTESQSTPKRRSENTARLIDVLGKGITHSNQESQPLTNSNLPDSLEAPDQKSTTLMTSTPGHLSQWHQTEKELEDLVAKGDADGFDKSFAMAIAFPLVKDSQGNDTDQWDFPEFRSSPGIVREKVFTALRLIFGRDNLKSTNTDEKAALKIQFFPPNVFHWLVISGQLTTTLIEQAMRQLSNASYWLNSLTKSDLVSAIVDFDPSFGLLKSILMNHIHLEIEDLAQAIKFIVRSLDNSTLPAPKALLTNGNDITVNGALDHDVDDEADAAMEDLDRAISTLENGLPNRRETLRLALIQLNAFPTARIIDNLRHFLSQHEVIFLIHILRIELADGGWTSRYIDAGPLDYPETETEEPSDGAITVVARLLSCAIDTIGVSGWLATSAVDPVDSVDELLVSLRAETSAALEGIHEATFMKGLLSEFLRYGWRRETEFKPSGKDKPLLESKLQTVLPLGLKVEKQISPIRRNAGGQVKERSKRHIGMEISMKVGKYSFERIRI
jgi:hypothetical protein